MVNEYKTKTIVKTQNIVYRHKHVNNNLKPYYTCILKYAFDLKPIKDFQT